MDPLGTTYDWSLWTPTESAVLCFVFRGDEILLIEKLRGLGAGKVNGPGGRINPGETAVQAAVRETQEEVGITPLSPELAGELRFRFVNGYQLQGYVFRSDAFEGEPGPTVEAVPFWCQVNRIPYDRMWADDRLWIPHLLDRKEFIGSFVFDDDKLIEGETVLRP